MLHRESDGELVTRGLFVGQDEDAYQQAAALSIKVNFTLLKEPVEKVCQSSTESLRRERGSWLSVEHLPVIELHKWMMHSCLTMCCDPLRGSLIKLLLPPIENFAKYTLLRPRPDLLSAHSVCFDDR